MAIIGIGTDRVVIARIAASVERFGDRFVQRVYSETEIEQANAKGNVVRRLAMLFAAKEAASKALGTGFRRGVRLQDIETVHLASGKPEISLHGAAASIAETLGIETVHISLTDDDGIAMAFAIAEGAGNIA
ncbi:holo-[acyl-carrier-protein] synthase [Mariprofundus ferrinatatus]|uniref:Holo-[acyl-carrier-protein] synthase n=1 Tax=Mariprofundus ferrinatatus TaxID=1921087 RepID=A0A2K8L4I9_9PROT|nr:holo-ACP synthase [Mariprofundus ferrinatatus]ATX82238.1 holo-[acyl-carrier-protein] synthase [Mariprofundus ferrinatatus]